MSEQRTRRAIEACGKWLAGCLSDGWPAESLDALEALWWRHHDERGNLIRPAPSSASAQMVERAEVTEDFIKLLRFLAANWVAEGDVRGGEAVHKAARLLAALAQQPGTQMVERLCRAIDGLLACHEIADSAPEDKDDETHAAEREARNARDAALAQQPGAPAVGADYVCVPRTTLEWIKAKTADKRNPAVAFVCDKLLRGETFDVLREGAAAQADSTSGDTQKE